MGIADLPPESLYKRALKRVEAGKLESAEKLLQVAVLKAPHEPTFREALSQVRGLIADNDAPPAESEDLSALSPEILFTRAEERTAEGNLEAAAQLLQLAIAKAPQEGRYRDALAELRAQRQPQKSDGFEIGAGDERGRRIRTLLRERDYEQASTLVDWLLRQNPEDAGLLVFQALLLFHHQEDLEGALKAARAATRADPTRLGGWVIREQVERKLGQREAATRTLKSALEAADGQATELEAARLRLHRLMALEDDTPAAPPPAVSEAVKRSSRLRIAGLALALLLSVTGGGLVWMHAQPNEVDSKPYQAVIPVQQALQLEKPTELMLRVSAADWKKLDTAARRARLQALLELAESNGYKAVFVEDSTKRLLGSARPKLIYVSPG